MINKKYTKLFLHGLLYLICLIIISSCSNTQTVTKEKTKSYNAIVGKVGPDCGLSRLITFYKEDGTKFVNPVYEINLKNSLKVEGTKLNIEWRRPLPSEMMVCHTLGPGYSQIYIIKAEKVE